MYSNNIVNFQESTTILNTRTKKSLETYWIDLVISYAKLISSSKIMFYKETNKLIDNGFPNHTVDEQIKRTIKNVNQ